MPKMRDIKVQVYLPPHIKKQLQIEAVRKKISMGQLASEALLAWGKFLRKWEMNDRKERQEFAEVERLKAEADKLHAELEVLLQNREANKKRRKK
jgi:hypothetical protein